MKCNFLNFSLIWLFPDCCNPKPLGNLIEHKVIFIKKYCIKINLQNIFNKVAVYKKPHILEICPSLNYSRKCLCHATSL